MKKTKRTLAKTLLLTSTLLPFGTGARAQVAENSVATASPAEAGTTAASQDISEDIVVTAQNRSQKLQQVPLAITALTGQKLATEHIATFADIAKIAPGFVSAPNYGYIRYSSMRGISNNQYGFADDPSIALFVDGVYQGRGGTGMQINANFDVDRIEVIKGPQATLFGRSSIAGAISIIMKQPTFDGFTADAMAGIGNYGRFVFKGGANVPLGTDWALRVAVDSEDRKAIYPDSGGVRGLGATNVKAGRAILAYQGDGGLTFSLKGTIERRRDNAYPVQTTDQPDFTVSLSGAGKNSPADFDIYEGVARIGYEFSPNLSATLTTAGRQVKNYFVVDYDARPAIIGGPYAQETNDRMVSQDLIILFDSGPFSASAGASWFSEKLTGYIGNWVNSTLAFTGAVPPGLAPDDYSQAFYELGRYNGKFHGYSTFADATIKILPNLRFTGGVRFNSDTKSYVQDIPNPAVLSQNAGKAFAGAYYLWGFWTSTPIKSKATWQDVSFRSSLSYDISQSAVAYASFNQGWKAGGIDSFKAVTAQPFSYYFGRDIAAVGGVPNVYNPEHSDSYELGIKSRFFDGRLTTNFAVYQYTYRDLQQNVTRGQTTTVENVGRARGRGFELEIAADPFNALRLFSNTAYNKTKVLSFPTNVSQEGLPLNRAPRWSGSAGAIVTVPVDIPGTVKIQGDMSYRTSFRTNNALESLVPGFALANLRLNYLAPSGKYGVSLYVENIFDKFTFNDASIRRAFGATPSDSRSVFGDPRMFGIDFTVRY